jgi:hypothetical protein
MTALVGIVVKRIFSVLARQSAGLRGVKTHEAGGEDLADLNRSLLTIVSTKIRDRHFEMMILDVQHEQRKCSVVGTLRLQNKWIANLRAHAKC